MCLGDSRFQNGTHALAPKWADLSLEVAARGMGMDDAKPVELPTASTASESDMDTEYSSAASSHAHNEQLSGPSLDIPSQIEPASSSVSGCISRAAIQAEDNLREQHNALCNGLSTLQEKQKKVLELLRSTSVSRACQGTFSRQVSTTSTRSEMPGSSAQLASTMCDASSVASGSAAEDQVKPSRTLVELRLKHLHCMEIAKDQKATGSATASVSRDEEGSEDARDDDLLPVIMAQITVNHIAQMGVLRGLQDSLTAQAEHEATQAKLEAALSEHAVLLSHYEALLGKHEALLGELQAQAGQHREQPPILHCASIGFAVAAAAAASAVLWTWRAKR